MIPDSNFGRFNPQKEEDFEFFCFEILLVKKKY
jgi:hypothetical protein